MAAHSSTLGWRIPWPEEPGWLQFQGLHRVGHPWSDWAHTHVHNQVSQARAGQPNLFALFVWQKLERLIMHCVRRCWVFPGGSGLENPPAQAGDMGSVSGWGRSPGRGNVTQSSILAWIIPRTKELGGLQLTRSQSDTTSDWAHRHGGVLEENTDTLLMEISINENICPGA